MLRTISLTTTAQTMSCTSTVVRYPDVMGIASGIIGAVD